ncbi:E1B small T-antigen [Bat mastadenovirus G]|uniref:E1B protein, small T-antigen n=1 Tax=Bat mastadenovirus G TaxID=2015376 RepID=A0A1J0FAP3_9ADEN|nr:E1B small T-antigen [Bat mastadenovirus G]APC26054.1 E1B small T-antigen [Bat mastadenovirus G]
MDLFSMCADYSSFRYILRGSLCGSSWVRKWCFPALADAITGIADDYEDGYWRAFPPDDINWNLLRRGYTFAAFTDLFSSVDLGNAGRFMSFLGFLNFILRNWPSDSVVLSADRLDLICVPAWTKIMLWSQTMRQMEELQLLEMAAAQAAAAARGARAEETSETTPLLQSTSTQTEQLETDL